jgi:BlaI family transcriptional regulator, penicillinase repressor
MTSRASGAARVRAPLTDLENEVMQVVWTSGPSSVEAVHLVVSRARPLKEATIRTILRRLEQKGYLDHDAEGRAFVYRAVEHPRSLAARAVRQIIDRFCRGSVEELVSGMVDAKVLSPAELATLEGVVRERRRASVPRGTKKGR